MKTIVVYELIYLDEEKLKNAYNYNLKIAWRPVFKKIVPDEYVEDKKKFEEKVLGRITEDLQEIGKRGRFDVRVHSSSPRGFFSLLEGKFLVI